MVTEAVQEQVTAEAEQPAPEDVTQPETTEETPEEQTAPQLLDDVLSREDVKAEIAKATEAAESRGRNKRDTEMRRQYRDPQALAAGLLDLVKAGFDSGEVTPSMTTKAANLIGVATQANTDRISEEVIEHFFTGYEFPQDVVSDHLRMMSAGQTDEAIAALVTGAVTLKIADFESGFQKRVDAEVIRRTKAELSNGSTNGGAPPSTPRGGTARPNGLSLTTAELNHPAFSNAIRGLTQAQRDQIYANVASADETHGAETLRDTILESVKAQAVSA